MSAFETKQIQNVYIELSCERVEFTLRQLCPIPDRYFLEQAVLYKDLESPDKLPPINLRSCLPSDLVISPDTRFIHASVRQWIFDNSFEALTTKFLKIRMYEHKDMVNVACSLRTSAEFSINLEHGLDVNPQMWLAVQTALMCYARPIKYAFVRASKADLKPDAKHEYLFDETKWQRRDEVLQHEARLRGEHREKWVQTMIDTLYGQETM